MTVELQEKLFKLIGAVVVVAVAIACIKLIPNEPETIAALMGIVSTAYGGVSFNTPINAVRRAKGLVSVRKPDADEEIAMRESIKRIDTQRPPAQTEQPPAGGEL